MKSHFFAVMSRMKYINRWGLMNNTKTENICEHSLVVAMLSHALVTISNERFHTDYDAEHAAMLGIFHDASEIITGDMPTPIKYYNPEIKQAYKQVENIAEQKLTMMLPPYLRDSYAPLLTITQDDRELAKFVKAADKLSALIKCIEEAKMGNREFYQAQESITQTLKDYNMQAVDVFMEEFLPSFWLTLDEQG